MKSIKEILPGLIIIFLITIVSFMLSLVHPSFDILVISMIFGMLIANFINDKEIFDRGIAFALKVFLPAGIALYGTQLSFTGTEPKLLFSCYCNHCLPVCANIFYSKGTRAYKNLGLVLSTGLSVCGASAIAVVSPLIGARKEETSISLIVVMVLGLAGMIFYPPAYRRPDAE